MAGSWKGLVKKIRQWESCCFFINRPAMSSFYFDYVPDGLKTVRRSGFGYYSSCFFHGNTFAHHHSTFEETNWELYMQQIVWMIRKTNIIWSYLTTFCFLIFQHFRARWMDGPRSFGWSAFFSIPLVVALPGGVLFGLGLDVTLNGSLGIHLRDESSIGMQGRMKLNYIHNSTIDNGTYFEYRIVSN